MGVRSPGTPGLMKQSRRGGPALAPGLGRLLATLGGGDCMRLGPAGICHHLGQVCRMDSPRIMPTGRLRRGQPPPPLPTMRWLRLRLGLRLRLRVLPQKPARDPEEAPTLGLTACLGVRLCAARPERGDGVIACLLYTSDAADEEDSVDLGGRRIIKKKKGDRNNNNTKEENTIYKKYEENSNEKEKKNRCSSSKK
eukprot:TRINITY_DN10728_c0_g1_i2.p1 TRINITY_DN10728_c0_g1~~TRINITY_DN10728_c0_g1_i2.p1  ORF type:complete len:196 (-),score=18.31 TRINITY_DN10728_c0_g1_i2:4-591(-)